MGEDMPAIGESSKVKSMLEMLNIAKVLALVIGILGFLLAAWAAWPLIYSVWSSLFGAVYWIVAAVINLMAYMRMDEFIGMVKSRRYQEFYDILVTWMVLTLIFGVIVGILLLIVFIEINDIKTSSEFSQSPPQQTPPPPPQ